MLDAAGKAPGYFAGTLTSLGDYDQCLDLLRHQVPGRAFDGQYCAIDNAPLRNEAISESDKFSLGGNINFVGFPFSSALCVPSTCTPDDLRHILSTGKDRELIL